MTRCVIGEVKGRWVMDKTGKHKENKSTYTRHGKWLRAWKMEGKVDELTVDTKG